MRKACEATDKAEHYKRRAEAARDTADGKQYSDPGFLVRRIDEQEAEERGLIRRLNGEGMLEPVALPSAEYAARLNELLEECRDKLGFYHHCLATCGKKVWNKESLKGMKEVFIRGRWEAIVKLNPKTVAIPNICFPDPDSQKKWALKYIYAEVKDAR